MAMAAVDQYDPERPVVRKRDMKTNMPLAPALLMIATLAFAIAPAVTPPFTGYLPGQMPFDVGRPTIQPAGYAFSIWGVIYLWLFAHAVFGLLRRRDDALWQRTRWPLIGAVALGSVWLAIATYWPVLATISIAVMAALAVAAFVRAEPQHDRWLLIAPLSIFAGWLTAATLVSLGVVLAGYGVLGNNASALAMLTLAVGVGLFLQTRQPTMPIYGATLVWALIAVVVVNWGAAQTVAIAAAIAAVAVGAGTAAIWVRRG